MTENLIEQAVIQNGDNLNFNFEHAIALAERLDFLDIQILRKFYITGKDYPFDCPPFCFPLFYSEMKTIHRLKISSDALRKRVNNLVELGLLIKVKHSYPTNYEPIRDKIMFIKAVVAKFFVINGLTKFLWCGCLFNMIRERKNYESSEKIV